MSSQMFNAFNNGNPILNFFGGFQNFKSQLDSFTNDFNRNSNVSAESTVKQMLNDGRMTQDQFNQLKSMADMITGRKR